MQSIITRPWWPKAVGGKYWVLVNGETGQQRPMGRIGSREMNFAVALKEALRLNRQAAGETIH